METALSIVATAQRDLSNCAAAQARSFEGTLGVSCWISVAHRYLKARTFYATTVWNFLVQEWFRCIKIFTISVKNYTSSTAVVSNLFCPKVYFSSSHHPEIYQSSVNITNIYTSYPVNNFTKLFLVVTKLLRSEIPSGICAKLRTVAARNNRVHMP